MNVFDYDNYLDLLKSELKGKGMRGSAAAIAKAARINPSYFSRILKGEVNLTPDQAAAICDYWKLDRKSQAYFLNLVHLARAGTPALKKILQAELLQFKKEDTRITNKISLPKFPQEKELMYFSSWETAAIHISLRIPKFRTEHAIAKRLCITPEQVTHTLRILEELELAKKINGKWEPINSEYVLTSASPMLAHSHRNWRIRMAEKVTFKDPDAFHYTSTISLGKRDFAKIRGVLQKAILETAATIKASGDEELYCLSVDWTKI